MVLPSRLAREIGLDAEPSWIVIDEMNVTDRSDPGILPLRSGAFGQCPAGLLRAVREGFADLRARNAVRIVVRDASA